MKKQIDDFDAKETEKVDKLMEKNGETGGFTKLMPMQSPCYLIPVAYFSSAVVGGSMPVFAIFMSKALTLLSIPAEIWEFIEGPDYVWDQIRFYALCMTCIAAGVGMFAGF